MNGFLLMGLMTSHVRPDIDTARRVPVQYTLARRWSELIMDVIQQFQRDRRDVAGNVEGDFTTGEIKLRATSAIDDDSVWVSRTLTEQELRSADLEEMARVLYAAAISKVEDTTSAPAPLGRLVDIGGRRLHLYCTGKGQPTVVLLAGAGAYSFDWALVQQPLSALVRVCSYDRAGLAWSDPGPQPHTERQAIFDLHQLLQRAGETGPFILAGHSLGGELARLYAARYPADVAGVLILDSGAETTLQFINGQFARGFASAQPRSVPSPRLETADSEHTPSLAELAGVAQFRKYVGEPAIDGPYVRLPPDVQHVRLWAMRQPGSVLADNNPYGSEEGVLSLAARIGRPAQLGGIPLIVIGRTPDSIPANANRASGQVRRILERPQELRDLGALSTNSVVIVASHSTHEIHIDQPELVLDAIRCLREAATRGTQVAEPTKGATALARRER